MKRILFLILLVASCTSEQTASKEELNLLKEKLLEKDNQVVKLQRQIDSLQKFEHESRSDYYQFVASSSAEINVTESLKKDSVKILDKKSFIDTLDISDNFYVYRHTAVITQTNDADFKWFMRNFIEMKSIYAEDFFVKVLTFYNAESLPLETENSKTNIHILIQPTELGYENKTLVISDFYDVKLIGLKKKNNSIELTFNHGKFPRKTERILIKPELVKFIVK
jgi:hypothetical protein